MLRGKAWRAVHSTERALLTLASLPPFTKSSFIIPSAMHSTMSKKRESWGQKGPVRYSHTDPHPAARCSSPATSPTQIWQRGGKQALQRWPPAAPGGKGFCSPQRGCHLDGWCPRVQPHVGAGIQRRNDMGGQKLLSSIRGEENHPTDLPGQSGAEAAATVTQETGLAGPLTPESCHTNGTVLSGPAHCWIWASVPL